MEIELLFRALKGEKLTFSEENALKAWLAGLNQAAQKVIVTAILDNLEELDANRIVVTDANGKIDSSDYLSWTTQLLTLATLPFYMSTTGGVLSITLRQSRTTDDNPFPSIQMQAAGSALGFPDALQTDDYMGEWVVQGYSGSSNDGSAAIRFYADGDHASDSYPARMEIWLCRTGQTAFEKFATVKATGEFVLSLGGVDIPTGATYQINNVDVVTSTKTGVTNGDSHDHSGGDGGAIAAASVTNTPAGSIAATDVQAAINELDGDISGHVSDTTDAHDASAISSIPPSGMTSDDVQEAIAELKTLIDAVGGATQQDYILIVDQKTQNTASGTFTAGDWRTRDLNTEIADPGGNASVASNQITLSAGVYRVRVFAPAYAVGRHQARLRNITDGTTILEGSSTYSESDHNHSVIEGRFSIGETKVLEVQHRCASTVSTRGFGVEANLGNEIYTMVELVKEGSYAASVAEAIRDASASAITDDDRVPFWETVSAGLASITWANIKATLGAGGSDTQIQFNDGGAFGGDDGLTWNKTNHELTLTGAEAHEGFAVIQGVSNGSTSVGLLLIGGDSSDTDVGGGTLLGIAGAGDGTGAGGDIQYTGGAGGATGAGGNVYFTGGAGGSTSGDGGSLIFQGGAPTDGNGGSITIQATGGQAGNNSGGDVTIEAGSKAGSGTSGKIQIKSGDSSQYAVLDTSGLTTSDKTFTFPDASGTLQLQDAELTAIAGLTSAADKGIQFTGSGTAALIGLKSGTYTPTVTNVANVDANTPSVCRYTRVGDVVSVDGKVQVDPTAASTLTRVRITLPIASNLDADNLTGIAQDAQVSGVILSDTTNDEAELRFTSGGTTNRTHYFHFSYVVA